MNHWISAPAQIRALAKAVSAAFAASNLEPEEKAPSKMAITDLPWQAPPLIADRLLMGVPLGAYLDAPLKIDEEGLRAFWTKTLSDMWYEPGRLVKRGTIANCGTYLPKLLVGQRALRFSIPGGYPAHLEETAGALFSLEVAHAAAISFPIKDLVQGDDDYYAVLTDGSIMGVKGGRPACQTDWNYDISGMVPDMLTQPRGNADYTPYFDQIASLRSVLHVHRKRFAKNFDALDQALQALRFLTLGGFCPSLVQEMYIAPRDMAILRGKERALRDAIELMPESMSDRSKLATLHNLLVPEAITATAFRAYIYSGHQFPFSLPAGKLAKIEAWLRSEYQSRIPAEIQQLKEMKC